MNVFFFQEKGVREVVLKAMGQAISKTVAIAEIIKVAECVHITFLYFTNLSDMITF